MTDNIKEVYTVTIERNDTEFAAVKFDMPADDFGKKMMSIMLYNIAEHLDPASVANAKQQ